MGIKHRNIGIIIVPAEVKAHIPGIILAILVIFIVLLLLKMYRRILMVREIRTLRKH
jgi:hypothetical protein